MKNIYKSEEFYVVADAEGNWWGSNTGPFLTLRNAKKEAEHSRSRWRKSARVVKMVPLFFDMETGECITPLPEGMM